MGTLVRAGYDSPMQCQARMVVRSSSKIYVALSYFLVTDQYAIYESTDGTSWQQTESWPISQDGAGAISIAIDSTGDVIHIIYTDTAAATIEYRTYTISTETLSASTTIETGDAAVGGVAIALDSDDYPRVAYEIQIKTKGTYYWRVHYSHNVTTGWLTPETVDPGENQAQTNYRYPSIGLNSANDPFISFQDITNSDLWVAKRTGTDTYSRDELNTDITETGAGFGDNCLCVDTDGYPHVVWVDGTDTSIIKHGWYTSFPTGDTTETAIDEAWQVKHPTIATDGSTYLYVFYEGTDTGDSYDSIWLVKDEGTGWSSHEQLQDGESDSKNWRYPCSKWSYQNNEGASAQIDYIYYHWVDGTEDPIYWDKYTLALEPIEETKDETSTATDFLSKIAITILEDEYSYPPG